MKYVCTKICLFQKYFEVHLNYAYHHYQHLLIKFPFYIKAQQL